MKNAQVQHCEYLKILKWKKKKMKNFCSNCDFVKLRTLKINRLRLLRQTKFLS